MVGRASFFTFLSESKLTNIRQHIRKLTFADVFAFVVIFFAALFNSLSQRSIIFNITIGAVLILKVVMGTIFYNQKAIGSLRTYFIARYAFNTFIVCPVFVIMRVITRTQL